LFRSGLFFGKPRSAKEAIVEPSPAFDPALAAKKLMRESRSGALATLLPASGDPYCSLVNVASAADGAPLLLISRLAVHTRNLLADPRVSLMLDERREGDPLEGARVMLQGNAAATDDPAARRRYLARHPEAKMFAGFADFAFYRIALAGAHLVAGFGRIVDLKASDILTETADAAALLATEPEIVAQLNAQGGQGAQAMAHRAGRLVGTRGEQWRCVGVDPEGLELQNGRVALRVAFSQRIHTPEALHRAVRELAG
jgi:heme iron utilization protein